MNNISAVVAKLHEIATILSRPLAGRTLREVFQEIAAKLPGLFSVNHSTITLLNEGGRFFRIEAEFPESPKPLVGQRITIHGRPTQVGLVDRQEPVVANDLSGHALMSESASFRQIVKELDIRSVLIVPMVAEGTAVGTINLDAIGRTKHFSKKEVKLCQTIASQVAGFVAINQLLSVQQKGRRQVELTSAPPTRPDVSVREEKITRDLFDELARVIPFKKASLQLIVNGKRILVGAFGFDKSSSHPWLLVPVEADPIIREIVHTRKLKIVPDTTVATEWKKQAGTTDVNSWIGMPLVFQGQTIGILTLDHNEAGFYANISPEHLLSAEELVVHAAHDLWAAYNLEVAQRQVQALEVVRGFAETVATKLDPKDLVMAIVTAIKEGLECTRCSIFLAEQQEERTTLVCKAACEASSCSIVRDQILAAPRLGQSLCPVQQAVQNGESVVVGDLKENHGLDVTHALYQGARSVLVAPLKIANQVSGAVLAVHEQPGWFSKADQLLLETLTREAASAIERDNGLELVHSIGNKILGATEVKAVLEDVVAGAIKLTHTDSGIIYEINEDCTQVIRSFMPEGSVHPEPRLDDPKGITRTVIAGRRILEIPDIEKDDRVHPLLRKAGYRSMFAVPLLLGQSVVGVLYINGKRVRELTETERSLLGTLAGQAALAIQRTRLHEQIRDSDALYRSLVDHIPQFVFRKDKNSRFTWANASFCQILGKKLHEIVGKSDFDFYPKEDAENYVRADREVMRTKRPLTSVGEANQPPGKAQMLVRVVKTPVLDAKGKVTGVQAIFWDITKEAEEKNLAERWRLLAEQSPDGIVVHEGGNVLLANPAAVRLFGVNSAAELEGHTLFKFLDEPSRLLAEDRLEKLARGEEVPMAELRVVRGPEDKVDVDAYTRRVPETGEIQTVFHDVTRAKTLLREMHHRVRRSFNQVNGFLLLQEQFTNDEKVQHAFATLRERVQATALVHSILSRTGQESDVEMDLYLADLRQALIQEYDSLNRVAVDFDFEIPKVLLDEKKATACGLIVTELVWNSLLYAFSSKTFNGRRGRVSVSLRLARGIVRLIVADNGIGFKKTLKQAGESMGLSLVRSLVSDDLEGTIEKTSARPGTRFTIRFRRKQNRKEVRHGK